MGEVRSRSVFEKMYLCRQQTKFWLILSKGQIVGTMGVQQCDTNVLEMKVSYKGVRKGGLGLKPPRDFDVLQKLYYLRKGN